jgi:integrase
MTPRRLRQDQLRRTENGTRTLSLGPRGFRVRLFENRDKGGMIYREVQLPNGRKSRRSLGTRDWARAKELGLQLVAALMSGREAPVLAGPVRLGELCTRFLAESPMHLDNTDRTQKEAAWRLSIVRAVIGDARDVGTLSENDVRQYEARRRAGGIRFGKDSVTGKVRQRSVQADIKLLKQVLYWACSITHGDGSRLLERNPLQYVKVKGEHDVARPIWSFERFEATRKAMRVLQDRYAEEARTLEKPLDRARAERRRVSWIRAELALVLMEATGKRRGSIVGLQWQDFDFATRRVTWRPEHDKKRKTWVVPYPADFFETVREFQRRLGAAGGYLFPRQDGSDGHAAPELLSQWIVKAEAAAGLPKLDGGVCHPLRRKWRSERRHLPMKAVAAAGGWTDLATMDKCYDLPDDEDVLKVTSETNKRRELVPAATCVAN